MQTTVLLIRHGESEVNVADPPVVGGRSSWCELTPAGVDQALRLGRALAARGEPFDRVYASPAVRTQQTARWCLEAAGRPVRYELAPELQELDQGEWTGRLRSAIYTPETLAVIDRDPWTFRAPGGESQDDLHARARAWLERLGPGRVWVFGHGVTTKVLLAGLFDLDRRTAWKIRIDNASVTRLVREDGGWRLLEQNGLLI